MSSPTPVDVTHVADSTAIAWLCTWNETVFTAAGRIEPRQDGFTLTPATGKPRDFATASGAVEVLRRIGRAAA